MQPVNQDFKEILDHLETAGNKVLLDSRVIEVLLDLRVVKDLQDLQDHKEPLEIQDQ